VRLVRAVAVLVATSAVLAGCSVHVPTPTPTPATSAAPGKPPVKKRHTGPGTVSGKILQNGKPVAGAAVQVVAWPKGTVLGKLHKGQKVPTKRLGRDSSADDGSYVVQLGRSGAHYRDGRVLNVQINVVARAGTTQWNVSLRVKHNGKTAPLHLSFDLGRRTVVVGGHKSHTQVVH
jgi:hypothetical protein